MKLFLFTLLLASYSSAQYDKIQNVWHFSNRAVDFNSGSPVALPSTQMRGPECTAGICDENGQLLFYTNGGSPNGQNYYQGGIWNRANQLMPNGALGGQDAGCYSTYQGTIVIPDPANLTKVNNDKYYIVTLDCVESLFTAPGINKGLRYTIVDMGLDNGFGDVTQKGIPIVNLPIEGGAAGTHECLTAIRHSNGYDYWIIFSCKYTIGKLLLSASGFSAPEFLNITSGYFAASPANDHVVIKDKLYAFDNTTGELTYIESFDQTRFAFSPNGKLLYAYKENMPLIQFDIEAQEILTSGVQLASNFNHNILLAPDKSIYGFGENGFKTRILCPNVKGTGCNFQSAYQLDLPGIAGGKPNLLQDVFYYQGNFCEQLSTVNLSPVQLKVYPNPVTDFLQVDLKEETEIEITDLRGKTISVQKCNGSIDFSGFSPGIYFISSLQNSFQTLKVTKE